MFKTWYLILFLAINFHQEGEDHLMARPKDHPPPSPKATQVALGEFVRTLEAWTRKPIDIFVEVPPKAAVVSNQTFAQASCFEHVWHPAILVIPSQCSVLVSVHDLHPPSVLSGSVSCIIGGTRELVELLAGTHPHRGIIDSVSL